MQVSENITFSTHLFIFFLIYIYYRNKYFLKVYAKVFTREFTHRLIMHEL